MTVSLVWAQSRNGTIGAGGRLPWHLPEDLAHFRTLTTGGTVLMGRSTWDALPDRFRPLPGRTNLVLTRRPGWGATGAEVMHSLEDAFTACGERDLWVIGGSDVFEQAVNHADVLEVTEINADFEGDTDAPRIPSGWVVGVADPPNGWRTSESGLEYRFLRYTRARNAG